MKNNLDNVYNQKRWNEIVIAQNGGVLHSFEWLSMEENMGIEVYTCFVDNDYLECAIPIFINKHLGVRVGWVPDGILYNGDIDRFSKYFYKVIQQKKLAFILTEFHCFYLKNEVYKKKINIPFKMASETLIHDLSILDSNKLIAKYNKTTRKYIRKGVKNKIECKKFDTNDLPNLYQSYLSLSKQNNFNPVLPLDSILYLFSLIDNEKYGKKSLAKCAIRSDLNGNNPGFLVTLSLGNRTLEFLRMDKKTPESKFSSRILTHNALLNSLDSSVCFYDFGGVERKKNPGIYEFKASFGGFLSTSTSSIIGKYI